MSTTTTTQYANKHLVYVPPLKLREWHSGCSLSGVCYYKIMKNDINIIHNYVISGCARYYYSIRALHRWDLSFVLKQHCNVYYEGKVVVPSREGVTLLLYRNTPYTDMYVVLYRYNLLHSVRDVQCM